MEFLINLRLIINMGKIKKFDLVDLKGHFEEMILDMRSKGIPYIGDDEENIE